MEIKKILIVTRAFYPENSPRSFRATELAKEFARQGHNVKVITSRISEVHDKYEKKINVEIKNLGHSKWRKIDVGGTRLFVLFRRAFRRLVLLLFEYPDIQLVSLVKKALKNEKGYDLLISIATPHPIHWGVASVWGNGIAKTWIADCGDPYMGTNTDSFKKLFYFRYVEKWWCRKVDFIAVPFAGAIEAYYPEFREKIWVIPQGFNFNEVKGLIPEYRRNLIPTFAYAGTLIPKAREIGPLLDYLFSLSASFRFIIYTNRLDLVRPYLVDSNNKKVEINHFIPRESLLKELGKVDFLVNINNSTSTQSPSKLIDYHLIGRPVLSINHKNLELDIINEFLDGNYVHRYQFDRPEQYNIDQIVTNFIGLK